MAEHARNAAAGSGPGGQVLAVSSWSWHTAYYAGSWSLLDLPASAAEAGIAAIECNDFMLPPPRLSRIRKPLLSLLPGAPPELWRYSRETLRQLKERARAIGATILTWTINSDFTVPAYQWLAQQLYLRRGLAAARLLKAPLLRVNLGGSPETPRNEDPIVARRMANFVRQSQHHYPGISVTVENHWGISTDIDRHLQIFDTAAGQLEPSLRTRLGCCFDPGNMPDGPDRSRWWRELAQRANHYHLKTTAFADSGSDNRLPHEELFALLRSVGYDGPVTIEFAGDGDPLTGVRQSARLVRTSGTGDAASAVEPEPA